MERACIDFYTKKKKKKKFRENKIVLKLHRTTQYNLLDKRWIDTKTVIETRTFVTPTTVVRRSQSRPRILQTKGRVEITTKILYDKRK